MKYIFVQIMRVISIICFMTTIANASDASSTSPMIMLNTTATQIIDALKENKSRLSTDQVLVYQIVNQYLIPHVDVFGMSRSVLGRNAWQQATDAQKQAFSEEFVKLIVRTYASPLEKYTDEVIHFLPVRGSYEGKKFLTVNSVVTRSQGNNIPLNYSLVYINNEWKIYDMSLEGVSLLQSFRSQFAEALSRGDIEQLIMNLKKHNQLQQQRQAT